MMPMVKLTVKNVYVNFLHINCISGTMIMENLPAFYLEGRAW